MLGAERELDGHDAGVRTHALRALGAAAFGAISVGSFSEFVTSQGATNVQVDMTRISSYVVAGVGFLAGGTIIKHGRRVRGTGATPVIAHRILDPPGLRRDRSQHAVGDRSALAVSGNDEPVGRSEQQRSECLRWRHLDRSSEDDGRLWPLPGP